MLVLHGGREGQGPYDCLLLLLLLLVVVENTMTEHITSRKWSTSVVLFRHPVRFPRHLHSSRLCAGKGMVSRKIIACAFPELKVQSASDGAVKSVSAGELKPPWDSK